MAFVLDQLRKGAHLAILRLRSLGDCVLTTPAIALLRQHRSDLRIAVVVEPRFRAVFEDNPDIDDLLHPSVTALRQFVPQLCINLHGGTRSLMLSLTSGARFRAGFAHYRLSSLYNVRIPTAQEILGLKRKVHTAEHLASAMFYLGVSRRDIPRARLTAQRLRTTRQYAVLHPMASAPEKTWPAERFLELASHLERDWRLEPTFIGAPGEDLSQFSRFRVHTGQLGETKSLLSGASLFVGNDSGPAHMAAAFGVPMVVLFAASDPEVWAPWRTASQTIVAGKGMQSVSTHRVVEALERLRVHK